LFQLDLRPALAGKASSHGLESVAVGKPALWCFETLRQRIYSLQYLLPDAEKLSHESSELRVHEIGRSIFVPAAIIGSKTSALHC